MDLIELYTSILSTAGMTVDKEGFVSYRLAKLPSSPVLVKGKRLVLPTYEQLKLGDNENRVAFHPLNESIVRGESEVLSVFRDHLNRRLNFVIGCVAIRLMMIGTSSAMHSDLSPDQTVFLTAVKSADEGTVKRLISITEKMMVGDESKSFAHIYVRRNAQHDKKKHLRVGVVSFPLYEELSKTPLPKAPNEVYGVELRKADRTSIKGILEYILPFIETPESYFAPSDSDVSPTTDALMKTLIKLGDQINTVVDLFGELLDADYEDLKFSGDWEEAFKDLSKILPQVRMIPPQPGNEGRSAANPTAGNVIDVKSLGNKPSGVIDVEARAVGSEPLRTANGVVMTNQLQPVHQPVVYGQPIHQPAQPAVVRTANGVVFDSVFQPVRQPAYYQPQGQQYQQYQPNWQQQGNEYGKPISYGQPAGGNYGQSFSGGI